MADSTFPQNPAYAGSNPYLKALIAGSWGSSETGPVLVEYALRDGADPLSSGSFSDGYSGKVWESFEQSALQAAVAAWEDVALVNLEQVESGASQADVWMWLGDDAEIGYLGWSESPGSGINEPLYIAFNFEDDSWTQAGLSSGGYGFVTLLHELGHLLGLGHPHDRTYEDTRFPGVSTWGDLGLGDQNQGINTVMSYNDGWHTRYRNHYEPEHGNVATPMALDIAAIQEIYGANMTTRTGNDTYILPAEDGAGTGWSSIWDAGGRDVIKAPFSNRSFIIDLRAAPLVGENAGGYVSHTDGVHGGFTIANGVVIENAVGGRGQDVLTGNSADNRLQGKSGDDRLIGERGKDKIFGGAGDDVLFGGVGHDRLIGGGGDDEIFGGSGRDYISGGTGSDQLNGRDGRDTLTGGRGDDALTGGRGADVFVFAFGNDQIADYDVGTDRLSLGGHLFSDTMSAADVVARYAAVESDGVVFDFGGGNSLTLYGLSSLTGIADGLDFA